MQVTETLSEDLKREFKVVVAAKDISEKLEVRLEELGQQVRIPGFRPGKVPLTILKQRFGTSVMGEIVEQAVNDAGQRRLLPGDGRARLAAGHAAQDRDHVLRRGQGSGIHHGARAPARDRAHGFRRA
jgi:hypothetical protein